MDQWGLTEWPVGVLGETTYMNCAFGFGYQSRDCQENGYYAEDANTDFCTFVPPSYEYGEWTDWEECLANCGSGTQRRYRACLQGDTVASRTICENTLGAPASELLACANDPCGTF